MTPTIGGGFKGGGGNVDHIPLGTLFI